MWNGKNHGDGLLEIIIDCDNYYYNSYLIERSVIGYRSDRFCCDVGICCLASWTLSTSVVTQNIMFSQMKFIQWTKEILIIPEIDNTDIFNFYTV